MHTNFYFDMILLTWLSSEQYDLILNRHVSIHLSLQDSVEVIKQ
jgi:hypothetical protein